MENLIAPTEVNKITSVMALLPVISTYNPIYRMYNPIYNQI